MKKDWQQEALIASYKRLKKKDSDRATSSVVEAVHVPAHLVVPGSHKPSRCSTFTLNSH